MYIGKVFAASAGVIGIGLGIVYGLSHFGAEATNPSSLLDSSPIEEIILLTDGVLPDEWITERLELPEGVGLMNVDIDGMKNRLEAEGQVKSAVITRDFSGGSLVVSLHEEVPVIRLMARSKDGKSMLMVVGRDGSVYRGHGYSRQLLRGLPFLDGVRLVRNKDGFKPISGVAKISELLQLTREDAPHLYRTWKVVSLIDSPRLIVKTKDISEIVFEPGNFRRQLAKLDYILDYYRRDPRERMDRIDLSFRDQVAVEVEL
ncbi:MAG: hypothetical protein JKY51_04790 [Opitutaceae bacterium]|nr:hypothetical protein [Opitutaceae bacterium]